MSAPIYELLSIEGAARYYDVVMQLLIRFTAALAQETCLVRHEDLVTEFAREMRRICTFLGLHWDPAMGDFALRTRNQAVLTPSTAQLVRGLSTEGLGQWRRYRTQLAPVLEMLEPWIERFYYDPPNDEAPPLGLWGVRQREPAVECDRDAFALSLEGLDVVQHPGRENHQLTRPRGKTPAT